jgi:hypothetical protein
VKGIAKITAAALLGLLLIGQPIAGTPNAAAAPPEPIPTHGMMLDSLATVVASRLIPAEERDRPVVVLIPIPGDSSGILAQRIVERLRTVSNDVRVRERQLPLAGAPPPTMPPGMTPANDPAQAAGPGTLELHARLEGAGVAYVRRIRSFPFGVRGYERLVTMRASATMQDPSTGHVAWARSASGTLNDVVPRRDLAYVSGGSAGWNPPLPQGSGLRLLEPIIVIGVVAGLVVLFYSNRN